jgi:hypothetical protein
MSAVKTVGLAGIAALALAACGSSEPPPEEAPPPVSETAFGDMVGTMDKARGVEDTTQEHKQALDRALEESSQ